MEVFHKIMKTKHVIRLLLLAMVAAIIAACSGDEAPTALPTEMQLPTLEPSATVEAVEPTAEPTEAPPTEVPPTEILPTEAPPTEVVEEATEEVTEEVIEEPQADEVVEESAPVEVENPAPPVEQEASVVIGLVENTSEFVVPDGATVDVRDCADATCNVIGVLPSGTPLNVVEQTDTWLTISYNNSNGFVAVADLAPPQPELPFADSSSGPPLPVAPPAENPSGPPITRDLPPPTGN